MGDKETSPEFTITMGPGVRSLLDEWYREIGQFVSDESGVHNYEELTNLLREFLGVLESWTGMLHRLFSSTAYDGNKLIALDGDGLFFLYDSGFHGGVLRRNADDPSKVRFEIHT